MNRNLKIEVVESEIARIHKRKYCLITSRASSAIYISLKSIISTKANVILPTISCPSPANAVLYSGNYPLFCDIDINDYNICPIALERILKREKNIKAIIAIHLYGNPAKMDQIINLAKTYKIKVIEDAAQCLGGFFKGKAVGSWGDLSILSFGNTKLLNLGLGGAVLTDDLSIFEKLKKEEKLLPDFPPNFSELVKTWKKTYYSLKELSEINENLNELFKPLPNIFKPMYLFNRKLINYEDIYKKIFDIKKLAIERKNKNNIYMKTLDHKLIKKVDYQDGAVPWRFIFTVPSKIRNELTYVLRENGIDVSNWYPSLYKWYDGNKNNTYKNLLNGVKFENEVINLWVDESITKKQIKENCLFINKKITELSNKLNL